MRQVGYRLYPEPVNLDIKAMSEEINQNDGYNYTTFLPWEQNITERAEREFINNPRDGNVYLQNPELQLVAEIAIVTGRPLLLRGEPGSGKSSFAPFVARNLDWRYYEFNVTGRTEAKDMLWRFDALRRLRDAQAAREADIVIDSRNYVTPGVLWWAFNRTSALEFIREKNKPGEKPASEESDGETSSDFKGNEPASAVSDGELFSDINSDRKGKGAVVLIDEIDKADPNVPNDLLEVIGLNRFTIDETGDVVERDDFMPGDTPAAPDDFGRLLIVITTNEERDLPPAFLRRCIVHDLAEPDKQDDLIDRWIKIAQLHASNSIRETQGGDKMVRKIVELCWTLREQTANELRRSPSIAEFLDVLKICFRLNIMPDSDSDVWKQVENSVLIKIRTQNV
jgi:MoxR-like ATPase